MTDVQAHLERLALEPADAAALAAVEDIYRGEGRWEELLRVYEDNALRASKDEAGPLLRKAAQLCLSELSSVSRAEAYLKKAIETVPSDFESLQALRKVYVDSGDYQKGVEIYEKELARTTEPSAKSEGWVAVAEIYRNRLNRFDKALAALKQAQRADKKNPAVHRSTAAIYEQQGRLDQAHAALMKELESGGASTDLFQRMGTLAQALLARPKLHALAKASIDAVLEIKPDNEIAKTVQSELDSYRSSWQDRVAEMEQRAIQANQSNPGDAADLWLTVAELQLIYGEQNESALLSIDRALAADPGHPQVLRLMEDIYGSQDRWGELATKLEMMAAYIRDPERAVDLYLKAAMHYAVGLDDAEASARLYQRVLEVSPGNKVASNALAEYYRERREWEKALEILGVWAERSISAADKVAAHYSCCRILDEEMGDRNRARPHYEAILKLDPENQAAARALEEVYRGAQDHEALARVLFAKLSGLQGEERIVVLEELGELYAGPLDQAQEAFNTLGELYKVRPGSELRQRLETLAEKTGQYASLVACIEGALDKLEDPGEQIETLHSVARLYEGPQ